MNPVELLFVGLPAVSIKSKPNVQLTATTIKVKKVWKKNQKQIQTVGENKISKPYQNVIRCGLFCLWENDNSLSKIQPFIQTLYSVCSLLAGMIANYTCKVFLAFLGFLTVLWIRLRLHTHSVLMFFPFTRFSKLGFLLIKDSPSV